MDISISKSLYLLNKVKDIQRLNVLKFYYKHCHNQLPPLFQWFIFKTRADMSYHDTRQTNILEYLNILAFGFII